MFYLIKNLLGTGITSYEKCTRGAVPSLRRNYPVQVQRVLSQLFTAPRGRRKSRMLFLDEQL